MVKEYNFYEALKEVMENGKKMVRSSSVVMFQHNGNLVFADNEGNKLNTFISMEDIEFSWKNFVESIDWDDSDFYEEDEVND